MSAALEASNVSKGYPHGGRVVPVVVDINLRLARGEFVCLLGPSGAGKSTLLHMLAGLEEPDAGSILPAARLGKVGLMPQKDLLLPWRTVLDNAALGLVARGEPRPQAREEARRWLARFGLAGFEDAYPKQLSGGMRQRVALIRTALAGQDVWLLDEPFGALDAITRADLQAWLLGVWEQVGKTVLFVTHDVDEALFLADRIAILGERPARLVADVPVPLGRPRSLEMLAEPAVMRLKLELLRRLRTEAAS